MIVPIVLLCVLLAVATWRYEEDICTSRHVAEVHIVITQGAGLQTVARQLEQQGVIASALMFRLYVQWQQQQGSIKAGQYVFVGDMSAKDVLARLLRGDVEQHSVTIAEGLRSEQVLMQLARQTHTPLRVWQSAMQAMAGDAQEGILLPETYQYNLPVKPLKILHRMRDAQQAVIDELTSTGTLSAHDIRVIASIIEKETAIEEEKTLISSVIHNRLQRHMPLQMDPTVIYGRQRLHPEKTGRLHRQDLREDSPWNTYTRTGLPATPICNPSRSSLQAAANPADTDFLYFVANGKGGHNFAHTLKAHQKNVRQWLHQ